MSFPARSGTLACRGLDRWILPFGLLVRSQISFVVGFMTRSFPRFGASNMRCRLKHSRQEILIRLGIISLLAVNFAFILVSLLSLVAILPILSVFLRVCVTING